MALPYGIHITEPASTVFDYNRFPPTPRASPSPFLSLYANLCICFCVSVRFVPATAVCDREIDPAHPSRQSSSHGYPIWSSEETASEVGQEACIGRLVQ